jgi:asparagine synthase (glutamine-hydrolysing)
MPGIVGFIVPAITEGHKPMLQQMVGCMLHEKFYSSGSLIAEKDGLGIGWVSHRGGYADCLPIWNERGDIALFFTGEHYADAAESQQLRNSGHQFSKDDASCLVHLYEEHGSKFFERLNGTFHGVLLDRRQGKIFVFNDRFGLGRLYYHESSAGFFFASEAKALLRIFPELRTLDLRGAGELLVCGCPMQNRTIFPGISVLPAGSLWTFAPRTAARKESYFDRTQWEALSPLAPGDYYDALKSTFSRILPRYFQGNQKIALSLTGGLDSRMIIAALNADQQPVPCYTFGGTYRDSEDVRVGRMVAKVCRQNYQVITVDDRFFPLFSDLAAKCVYVTDGTMDVSGAVGLYANRQARDIAPIRMTGNYGSEILRGNLAFKAGYLSQTPYAADFRSHLNEVASTYAAERSGMSQLSFIAYKQVPWHHFARYCEEYSQLTIRAPYLDNELVPLAYRAPEGLLLNKQFAYRYTTDLNPALAGVPTDRGMLNRPTIIPKKLFNIWKELRPQAEYYFDYGMPHWLTNADRLLKPLRMERLFLGQQKYYHFRAWYRGPLAEQIKRIILDPKTLSRSYLNKAEVEALVERHTSGRGNHTIEIHKILTLEMIERQLLQAS